MSQDNVHYFISHYMHAVSSKHKNQIFDEVWLHMVSGS